MFEIFRDQNNELLTDEIHNIKSKRKKKITNLKNRDKKSSQNLKRKQRNLGYWIFKQKFLN
jgi:hypothetical protein